MEYFSAFPKTTFNNTTITDITVRLNFIKKIKDNAALFEYIILRQDERAEDVAFRYYKDPNLYWIILFINDVVDPYYDWVLSDDALFTFVQDKYGVENVYAVHHYKTTSSSELGEDVWVDFGTPFSIPVSNYDYEQELNEEKRKIKVLKPVYIAQVLSEYKLELM
jgi:phage-related protein